MPMTPSGVVHWNMAASTGRGRPHRPATPTETMTSTGRRDREDILMPMVPFVTPRARAMGARNREIWNDILTNLARSVQLFSRVGLGVKERGDAQDRKSVV